MLRNIKGQTASEASRVFFELKNEYCKKYNVKTFDEIHKVATKKEWDTLEEAWNDYYKHLNEKNSRTVATDGVVSYNEDKFIYTLKNQLGIGDKNEKPIRTVSSNGTKQWKKESQKGLPSMDNGRNTRHQHENGESLSIDERETGMDSVEGPSDRLPRGTRGRERTNRLVLTEDEAAAKTKFLNKLKETSDYWKQHPELLTDERENTLIAKTKLSYDKDIKTDAQMQEYLKYNKDALKNIISDIAKLPEEFKKFPLL